MGKFRILAPGALAVMAACPARPDPAKESRVDAQAIASTGGNRSIDAAGPVAGAPETAPAALAAAEKAAFAVARPVFEKH